MRAKLTLTIKGRMMFYGGYAKGEGCFGRATHDQTFLCRFRKIALFNLFQAEFFTCVVNQLVHEGRKDKVP